MHTIGIRNDLNEFFHIHPAQAYREVTQGSGKEAQTILEEIPGMLTAVHTFSKPGVYKVWSEIKKGGVDYTFGHTKFEVEGDGAREEKEINLSRTKTVNGYQVSLGAEEVLVKGKNQILSLEIHDSAGREIELENYLGAQAHLAIIKDDLKQLIHTHPMGHSDEHMGGLDIFPEAFAHGGEEDGQEEENMPMMMDDHGVNFQTVFPEAGLYKAFVQFRPGDANLAPDNTLIAEFWVKVEEKKPLPVSPWWINLIWSAIAIVILSLLIRRYLNVEGKR